jgi:hypothetical protein
MIDREKVTSVLIRRFPHASHGEIAAAANAIVGLGHEYEALDGAAVQEFHCTVQQDQYTLADVLEGRIRVFARRED